MHCLNWLCTKSTAPARIAIIRTRSGSDGPKNQLEKPRVFANHIIQRRAHGRSLPLPVLMLSPFCARRGIVSTASIAFLVSKRDRSAQAAALASLGSAQAASLPPALLVQAEDRVPYLLRRGCTPPRYRAVHPRSPPPTCPTDHRRPDSVQ